MLELITYFLIGLLIIGIPSYIFYRIGVDTGIQRGVQRQVLRELVLGGIIEQTESPRQSRSMRKTT